MEPAGSFDAVVLAGGRSSRLGFDKALLRINGEPLVQWLPSQLAGMFGSVAIVVDRPKRYDVTFPQLLDTWPDAGPLAGIAAGLQASAAPALFVCGCDMPLLQPALLQRLCSALEDYDLAIPERAGRLEPLCAVYAASCLPVIQQLLRDRRLRANGVAEIVRTRTLTEMEWRDLDPEGDSFLSINAPSDLLRLQARAATYGLTLERRVSGHSDIAGSTSR
jgi:molybdopterin-guanine dinucleotide biosynthesis protein A